MRGTRIRIDVHGSLEIVDPGFDSLELLREIDPGYTIQCSQLPGFESPRFLYARSIGCGLALKEISEASTDSLWELHDTIVQDTTAKDLPERAELSEQLSLLDLKIELCRRILSHCVLCGRRCGVDRMHGEAGICGLETEAVVADQFVHIAEEPPINPSLLISLYSCGLRCRYCQQWDLLEPITVIGELLDETLWPELNTEGARSLSFIGGNPDESLYAILRFLRSSPPGWRLPVVWNCHSYSSPETLKLLNGIVDAYVPDLKYGSENCGRELSGVPNYPDTARKAISTMTDQGAPVIVRLLVLPGHAQCCHMQALRFLSYLASDMLFVSVRGQYCPDWIITQENGEMARRPSVDEIEAVYEKAYDLGLRLI